MGKLALAAAVGLFGYGVSQADAALVIDIRATSVGGVPVVGDSDDAPEVITIGPGQVVTFDVVARVTGTNTLPDEFFKSHMGIFRSSTGGLLGDLQASNVAPFLNAAQPGTPLDYDSDGDLDIGSTQNSSVGAHFFTASSGINAVADGTVTPNGEEFVFGRLTFTADADATGETFLDYLDRRNPTASMSDNVAFAGWNEDGDGTANPSGVRNGQSPFTVDGVSLVVPEPTGMALAGVAALGLLARRRNKNA